MLLINWKQKIIVFIAIVIIAGVPMWLSTYTQYLNNTFFRSMQLRLQP